MCIRDSPRVHPRCRGAQLHNSELSRQMRSAVAQCECVLTNTPMANTNNPMHTGRCAVMGGANAQRDGGAVGGNTPR
eukprot:821646-Alexandrium_andersonii.AAC.1